VSAGDVVWAVLGALWLGWALLSGLAISLPGPLAALRAVVATRAGRVLALAAWGGAGWHLFCQRP
jgi:hypothetical protein